MALGRQKQPALSKVRRRSCALSSHWSWSSLSAGTGDRQGIWIYVMRIIHRLFKAVPWCCSSSKLQPAAVLVLCMGYLGCSSEAGVHAQDRHQALACGGPTNTELSCGSLSPSSQSSAEHQAVLKEPLCSQHQLLGSVMRSAASRGLQEMRAWRQQKNSATINTGCTIKLLSKWKQKLASSTFYP